MGCNKLGMHIHSLTGEVFTAVQLLQPRVVTLMDPTQQWVNDIRAVSPETFIVGRKYEGGQSWGAGLIKRVVRRLLRRSIWQANVSPGSWADQCAVMAHCDAWYTWNEPFGHDHTELFAPFDAWQVQFRERLLTHGMEAIGLCFGTGNFTKDGPNVAEAFPLTCQSFKYIGPHDYSWPDVLTGEGWYAMRWLKWLEDIGRDDIEIVIGEAGITQAVIAGRDDVGWRSDSPENVTEDSYIASLDAYNRKLCEVSQCKGCALFDWGSGPYGWGTFEHIGLEHRIFQIQAPESPGPPTNGGDPMVKIYDFQNNPFDPNATTRDWPWLRTIFGPDLRIHDIEDKEGVELQPGDIIYKVQWLDCKVGETSVLIHIEGLDGAPEAGKLPVFGWPSAEPHGLADEWGNWTTNGVHGLTNVHGDVGPSMGTGAYYDWSQIDPETGELGRGPHFVWVWDLPSDYVDGIGMLPWHPDVGGNHLHVNIGYKAEVYQEEEPETPTLDQILAVVNEIRTVVLHIEDMVEGYISPEPPVTTPFYGEYFNNADLSGEPTLVREDEKIDFDWGGDGPGGGINADQFSARWTGSFTFAAGEHTFCARVDDGVRLWVGGNLIIDQWHDQAATTHKAVVVLSAGKHDIKMEYYENAGGAVAKLWWT